MQLKLCLLFAFVLNVSCVNVKKDPSALLDLFADVAPMPMNYSVKSPKNDLSSFAELFSSANQDLLKAAEDKAHNALGAYDIAQHDFNDQSPKLEDEKRALQEAIEKLRPLQESRSNAIAESRQLFVTYGSFRSMPLTMEEADAQGWTMIADSCKDTNSPFRGRRYMYGTDHATILIFGRDGGIAGIQVAFKTSVEQLGNEHNFRMYKGAYQLQMEDNQFYIYTTAYFRDPETICRYPVSGYHGEIEKNAAYKARSKSPFFVGDRLLFLIGLNKQEKPVYMEAPLLREHIGGKWTEGGCFEGMGLHYWYDAEKDQACEDFFPWFLLYNKNGVLHSFGFAFALGVDGVLEHPPLSIMDTTFQEANRPSCMDNVDTFSSQHVYFNTDYITELCE